MYLINVFALLCLCLSQKVEHTVKTTADGHLACTFCPCVTEKDLSTVPGSIVCIWWTWTLRTADIQIIVMIKYVATSNDCRWHSWRGGGNKWREIAKWVKSWILQGHYMVQGDLLLLYFFVLLSLFSCSRLLHWTANQNDLNSLTGSAADWTRSVSQKATDNGQPVLTVWDTLQQPRSQMLTSRPQNWAVVEILVSS